MKRVSKRAGERLGVGSGNDRESYSNPAHTWYGAAACATDPLTPVVFQHICSLPFPLSGSGPDWVYCGMNQYRAFNSGCNQQGTGFRTWLSGREVDCSLGLSMSFFFTFSHTNKSNLCIVVCKGVVRFHKCFVYNSSPHNAMWACLWQW